MTRVVIVLEIEGKPNDAFYVVDALLDTGWLQTNIEEHEFDAGELRVTRAVACTQHGYTIDFATDPELDEREDPSP
jgi:hypothetical protein